MKLSNRTLRQRVGGSLFFLLLGLIGAPLAVLGAPLPQGDSSSAATASQGKPADLPADGASSTEPATCATCHDDITASFEKSPHWKTMNDTRGGHAKQGCEGCHGPGGEHADDPSKSVFDFKTAKPEAITERCLSCHASGSEHMSASNSFHRQNDVTCTSCHSMHHATTKEHLLIKAEPGLCYSCHLQQKAQFNMPFHHRVNEGLINCTDCHNQHGTGGVLEGDHLIRQVRTSSSGDMVCFRCHADKQGPFVFEHAAVRQEGCGSCHMAHGGANAHMLKYSNIDLVCLQCHTNSPGIHATVMDANQSHYEQACANCHVKIHGSNFDALLEK
jgi:DmsE family decaheme c-type cytochrome